MLTFAQVSNQKDTKQQNRINSSHLKPETVFSDVEQCAIDEKFRATSYGAKGKHCLALQNPYSFAESLVWSTSNQISLHLPCCKKRGRS